MSAQAVTKMFVVMGNDYPAAVYSTIEGAEQCCERRRKAERTSRQSDTRTRFLPQTYWRVYEFKLNEG